MKTRTGLLVLALVACAPIAIVACSAKSTYEGGGRALESPTTQGGSDEDTGIPDAPIDTGSPVQDVFVPPDTGPKDAGGGG